MTFIVEFMVPALKDVNLKIVSPTCFQVGFHGMKPVGNVSILGYKLKWSTWADMRTLAGASNIIPIGSKPIKIDGLEYGKIIRLN